MAKAIPLPTYTWVNRIAIPDLPTMPPRNSTNHKKVAHLTKYGKAVHFRVHTIVETKTFSSKAGKIWTQQQYEDFVLFLAQNPGVGEPIPGSGGIRKIRWGKEGVGKRGGVRVVYFNSINEETWLLIIYAKNERESIPAHELKKIKEAINNG